MQWFGLVIAGHLLTAVSFVLTKILLSGAGAKAGKSFSHPIVFTFYIGLLGLLAFALFPFGFEIPSLQGWLLDIATGGVMGAALLCFLYALRNGETSRIVPVVGAGIPICSLIFELAFLDTAFSLYQLAWFGLLVFGSVLITFERGGASNRAWQPAGGSPWVLAVAAAVLFAVSFGLSKIAYSEQLFMSAFIWIRVGTFFFVLTFLCWRTYRTRIAQSVGLFKRSIGGLYIGTQAFGALGFILINYALTAASLAIVNALQGVQYIFLFLITVLAAKRYPQFMQEQMLPVSLTTKIIGVLVISIGLFGVAHNSFA